ncbi:metallophosphoesterase [Bacillus sp. V3B]|uniref:metallophosphoesterase n=1 Tax=Bacillus sp. V3B TaxID=2804915 RepID=UPI00210F1DF8|nr:metallophosphoesterase [Bacillus sp. V3B]MCQ6275093.1 metallophosphoesterase [Bacillus sp. V3B]
MTKKWSRRTFIKKIMASLLTMVATGTGGYYYAREIEPKLLDINHHSITRSHIPKGFDQFRMIQFSDTHLGFQYTLKQLEKLIDRINQLNPDIVFFTGDLIDEPNKYKNSEQIIPILLKLNAPFGKFAVYGNHDHGGYGTDLYTNIMNESGFVVLQNDAYEIKLLDHSRIHIIGLDDAMLGKPDLEKALDNIPSDTYKILLAHEPDLAEIAVGQGIHLQLSGHSHGGQVKIPFFGALVTPPYSELYYEGFYELGDSQDPMTLYVNRGLGTTRLPFRFLSKPELTLFTIDVSK